MAHISDLRIFPVKGLDPVQVPSARVLASGALEMDRRWAMVDSRGKFINGKNRSEVHSIDVRYDLDRREMLVDGHCWSLEREGEAIACWFSEYFGEQVQWREDTRLGFPDDTASPGPTLTNQASLEEVAHWFAFTLESTRRRFRANVEIAGVEPFWEDRLYGLMLRAGSVLVEAVNPCQRCIVPTRDSLTGEMTPHFQKRFAELRKEHLPAGAAMSYFSHYYRFAVNTRVPAPEAGKTLRLGDQVGVLD